ncbi:8a6155d9-adbd-4eaf-95f6-142ba3150200 [Thermothielavioides terrestris]|uniref:Ig-like domain-containing protein n=2 Tax=Thermothielavioides terrestris TaxID=2587410 RepID=G2QVQ6_THETT|nr:uncharacterized protein THITE_2041988 [Thermothielavioides terrestris NRRL 8126]AEO63837.1 hypothetical protein THITE_2041988 [Thermothielavioides terrestris NRRL 8126]SPQ23436.1 8a6155d9-adbd-4eaf-95f6-142ba3150200 [Thermothielavioides terrestris]
MFKSALIFALSTALLPSRALAARPCNGSSSGSFEYRLGDVRYDGPDPSKVNGLSTIAASLQNDYQTPLYECVAEWPEAWAGWYEGGSNPIWADCIFTGAGLGQDETVSFAVDWKAKTMYLAHTFACSDKQGSEGLATGSITLDVNCTTADGSSYCVPSTTSTGARPNIDITTKLTQTPLNETSTCSGAPKQYQSWKLENWLRQIRMEPGSSPTDPKLVFDSGPSFELVSIPDGGLLNCTTSGNHTGTFVGTCQAAGSTSTSADFTFDPKLNMLEITQHSECSNSSSVDVVGVFYMQAACERVRNSDLLTCTSDPVWVGTGTV